MYPDLKMDEEAQQGINLVTIDRQVSVQSKTSQTNDEADVRRIFEQYDTNNDGFLDTREIKELARLGHADEIRRSVVKKILRRADENNDGQLSYDEFLRMHNRNRWLLKELSTKYTRIVPHRQISQYDQMRPKHVPWLMSSLTVLQVVIYIYNHYTNGSLYDILQFNLVYKTQVWHFISYMLIHSGLGHLLGNMVLQLVLGIPLEIYNGWWRVLVVYLSGGIAGCLGHGLFRNQTLRGASAGDYALLTAHIASVVINWRELEHGLVQIFLSAVYCIISVIVAATDPGNNVSHFSHFFGALAGLLVGFCVLQNLNIKWWERTLKIVSLTSFAVLMLIGGVCLFVFR